MYLTTDNLPDNCVYCINYLSVGESLLVNVFWPIHCLVLNISSILSGQLVFLCNGNLSAERKHCWIDGIELEVIVDYQWRK